MLLVCLVSALASCGDEEQRPQPDRAQIRDVVLGFYRDVVDNDIDGACDKLTGRGRASAIGRGNLNGRRRPVSEIDCEQADFPLRDSTELPGIVEEDLLRVGRVEISGNRAQAFTTAGAYNGVQRLVRTDEGWKLDSFDAMVHH